MGGFESGGGHCRQHDCRWFASEKLKSWRYHCWRHILDPQAFLERARPVLEVYQQAQALLLQGIWVVCVDLKLIFDLGTTHAPKQLEDWLNERMLSCIQGYKL